MSATWKFRESGLTPRTCFTMNAESRIREVIRAHAAVLYPECATQMCELVAQGRARVVVSAQDRRGPGPWVWVRAGHLTWTCY
jgi:hypothetical protein